LIEETLIAWEEAYKYPTHVSACNNGPEQFASPDKPAFVTYRFNRLSA
jgi:hypothetical protein